MTERIPTGGEEIANSVSHGLALLVALVATPFLIGSVSPLKPWGLLGASVFAASLLLLYCTSTLYHALPDGRGKRICLQLDYSAIYLFIAGSYTPFALVAPESRWSWTVLTVVWLLAAVGIALKALRPLSRPWVSALPYVAMGWLVLVAAIPLVQRLQGPGLPWLVAGGVAYTVGVVFFALDNRLRYAHSVRHSFVAAGSGCHFVAVMVYVA